MVLGFPRLEDYLHHSRSHGAIVGRIANRTAGASFTLDGQTYALTANEGANHLHGGATGLGNRIWEMETDTAANTLYLFYHSPDGEEGYPGAVDFAVTFRLEGPRLICEMAGTPDRPDPDQPRQPQLLQPRRLRHGEGPPALGRRPRLHPDRRRADPDRRDPPPRGHRLRLLHRARDRRHRPRPQPRPRPRRDRKRPAARARCPRTGRQLELWTDEPGLQLFDASAHDDRRPPATTARATAPTPVSASRPSTSPTACTTRTGRASSRPRRARISSGLWSRSHVSWQAALALLGRIVP